MVLLMCVLWAACAGTLQGLAGRGTSFYAHSTLEPRASVHHLPLFQHAPGPLVARELFRPDPHKRPLPHGLEALLVPSADRQQPGDTPPSPLGPVDVWCGVRQISVRVDRLRLRHWSTPSLFRLSTCPVSGATLRYLYFHRELGECGGQVQVVGGQLVYAYSLQYAAPPQGSVVRVPPLNLAISCHYNRFFYSYRVGFQPHVQPSTFLKSIHSKPSFTLTVCNDQWEPLPPGHWFFLGEPVYFSAQTGTALLAGERLYVDSCHATSSKDPNSSPKVDIITNSGCMVDSRRASSSSRFVSRGPSELRFSVDSFLFATDTQILYLHCSMSVGLRPSPSSKSCSYQKAVGRWDELEAPPSVCSCCDSVCMDTHDSVRTTVSSAGWYMAPPHEEQNIEAVSEGTGRRGQTKEMCHNVKDPLKEPCVDHTGETHWTGRQRVRARERPVEGSAAEQVPVDTDLHSQDIRPLFKTALRNSTSAQNHTITANASASVMSPSSAD